MRFTKTILISTLFCLSIGPVLAETVEQRVARLEKLLASQSLVEMLTRLETLQQEVQQLRGEIEEQTYHIDQLKQRQRELYLDVDRRLSMVERERSGVAVASTPPAAGLVTGTTDTSPVAAPTQHDVKPTASPAQLKQERDAYQRAFDLLKELRYEQAISAFRGFLKQYPSGRYAHIAQYWLGEANYARREFKQAIKDYNTLMSDYPSSPKLAEAMLKIGYSQNELGQKEKARAILSDLAKRYPGTTEAGQAEALLKRMQK